WHPERMNPKGAASSVLVVGAGPAGLEAARALSLRGYEVALAEAGREIGGRVARERRLPGLSAWGRVADYRAYQLSQRANVQIYKESELDADQILEFGFQHVCIATGARWRRDGVARQHVVAMPMDPAMPVFTPDDIMDGQRPAGHVVVFDDDHYYMGGVLAELLAHAGAEVSLVTPAPYVSDWARNTLEQGAIHRRLAAAGVGIVLNRGVARLTANGVETNCTYTDARDTIPCDAVLLVTAQQANDALYRSLSARQGDWAQAGILSVQVIGDANAPGPIAWATFAGHRYARDLDTAPLGDALPFRREVTALAR
ncbi:MAG: FAD-dependent oxidoreductase, partial [Pseudooceanicola sp.]|nr:FAD-dependent oxidoreductase [Pseudooceanicola sp.]